MMKRIHKIILLSAIGALAFQTGHAHIGKTFARVINRVGIGLTLASPVTSMAVHDYVKNMFEKQLEDEESFRIPLNPDLEAEIKEMAYNRLGHRNVAILAHDGDLQAYQGSRSGYKNCILLPTPLVRNLNHPHNIQGINEIKGILGHELEHLRNNDDKYSLLAQGLIKGLGMLPLIIITRGKIIKQLPNDSAMKLVSKSAAFYFGSNISGFFIGRQYSQDRELRADKGAIPACDTATSKIACIDYLEEAAERDLFLPALQRSGSIIHSHPSNKARFAKHVEELGGEQAVNDLRLQAALERDMV